MKSWLTGIVFFLLLIAAWQWLVTIGVLSHVMLPTPLEVAQYFVSAVRDGSLWGAILVTMKRLASALNTRSSPGAGSVEWSKFCA